MTTIATDGKSMAGDGLTTSREIVVGSSTRKVRRLPNGGLAGGAGECDEIRAMIEWIGAGRQGKPPGFKSTRVLVLNTDGTVDLFDSPTGIPVRIEAPAAIGSGGEIALGAMDAGKSAAEALGIAAKRDPSTGGSITEETL